MKIKVKFVKGISAFSLVDATLESTATNLRLTQDTPSPPKILFDTPMSSVRIRDMQWNLQSSERLAAGENIRIAASKKKYNIQLTDDPDTKAFFDSLHDADVKDSNWFDYYLAVRILIGVLALIAAVFIFHSFR